MLRFAFGELRLARPVICANRDRQRSIRLLERLGARFQDAPTRWPNDITAILDTIGSSPHLLRRHVFHTRPGLPRPTPPSHGRPRVARRHSSSCDLVAHSAPDPGCHSAVLRHSSLARPNYNLRAIGSARRVHRSGAFVHTLRSQPALHAPAWLLTAGHCDWAERANPMLIDKELVSPSVSRISTRCRCGHALDHAAAGALLPP
jgi:hypothetical protein